MLYLPKAETLCLCSILDRSVFVYSVDGSRIVEFMLIYYACTMKVAIILVNLVYKSILYVVRK